MATSKLAASGAVLVFLPVLALVALSGGAILEAPWAVMLLIGSPFTIAHGLFAAGMLLGHVALVRSWRWGKPGLGLALASVLGGYAVVLLIAVSFVRQDLVFG